MNKVNISEMQQLISSISFKYDYWQMADPGRNFILVEGETDAEFIIKSSLEQIKPIKAKSVFLEPRNCKKAILDTFKALEQYHPLITMPDGWEKWKLFGLIDWDYEEQETHERFKRLFHYDRHDLETTLLSLDEDLLFEIGISIKQQEKNKIYFMAYQLGCVNRAMYEAESFSCRISDDWVQDVFTDEGVLKVEKLIKMMEADKSTKGLSVVKISKYCSQLNRKGEWQITYSDFCDGLPLDFWDIVNGHDIGVILRFVSDEAQKKYWGHGRELNRDFEFALIRNFDVDKFKSSQLFKKLAAIC